MRAALKLSHDLTLAQPASADITMPTGEATAAEAAQVFGSLLEIDESRQLNRPSQIFGKGRVLWQQRAFTVAADLLIQVRLCSGDCMSVTRELPGLCSLQGLGN